MCPLANSCSFAKGSELWSMTGVLASIPYVYVLADDEAPRSWYGPVKWGANVLDQLLYRRKLIQTGTRN